MSQPLKVCTTFSLRDSFHQLGIIEQAVLLTSLSQLDEDETVNDEGFYTVSLCSIASLLGIDATPTYSDLVAAAKNLRRTSVVICLQPAQDGVTNTYMEASWVQTCVYDENEEKIELRLNKDMIPFLIGLHQQIRQIRNERIKGLNFHANTDDRRLEKHFVAQLPPSDQKYLRRLTNYRLNRSSVY